MSNLLTESFDWFPTGKIEADRALLWGANEMFVHADGGNMIAGDVRSGLVNSEGKAITIWGSLRGFFLQEAGYVMPTGVQTNEGWFGVRMYVDSGLPSQTRPLIGLYDAVTDKFQFSISFENNGVIKAWKGTKQDGILIAASKSGAFVEDQAFHCEVYGLIANTGGKIEVRINTEQEIQVPDTDTQNTSNTWYDSIFFGGHSTNTFVDVPSTHPLVFDDIFLNDASGTENSSWGGNLRVKGEFMIANGSINQFSIGGTSPASTLWQSVLNNSMDDTKYAVDSTPGHQQLFVPNPTLNSPLVRAVQVRLGMRQDDATQRSAKALLKLSTVHVGALEFFTNTTYTFYKQKWETNPETSVTFTGSEVNGCQVGVEVVS